MQIDTFKLNLLYFTYMFQYMSTFRCHFYTHMCVLELFENCITFYYTQTDINKTYLYLRVSNKYICLDTNLLLNTIKVEK